MRKVLFVICMTLLLQACGTMPYTPSEYPLRDGLIQSLPVNGTTTIANNQPATEPVIVYSYGGSKLASNLNAITEVMVKQAQGELAKNGKANAGGPAKSIQLKVNSLLSTYGVFYWRSNLNFEAKLGDGTVVTKTVPHGSGVLLQDLNGAIAESVMVLLNDGQVRAYLAK
jgi:hypothetical protein